MDYQKTGKFLAELRKEREMTQKELGDLLGVSDKTISKWETGNSLPDLSYFEKLTDVLQVSANEIITGEKLPPEAYSKKAEENIMDLLKNSQSNRRGTMIQVIAGIVLLLLGLFFTFVSIGGISSIYFAFLDFPSLIMVVLLTFGFTMVQGIHRLKPWLQTFQKNLIPVSCLVFLIGCMMILWGDPSDFAHTLALSFAVAILPLFYGLFIHLVLGAVIGRMKDPDTRE